MRGARTRGQATALGAVTAMVRGPAPHAVLLTGPGGVGKTTLALDLAAGLLCVAPDAGSRPCGTCRGCRMVEHGNHPDLHRLAPAGAGGQIVIGGPGSKQPGVRDLVGALALLPVEGGARVAIVERADRMNEDAQSALLKTLEEPSSGVTIVLCADEEARLLPTVHSRCARVRLGPLGQRDVEAILEEQGVADAPTAARLGRVAGGLPGIALAYAASPDAVTARAEIERTLLDLLGARAGERLQIVRELVARTAEMLGALDRSAAPGAPIDSRTDGRRRRAGSPAQPQAPVATATEDDDEAPLGSGPAPRTPAADRRRAASALLTIWAQLARDILVVSAGVPDSLRHIDLLEEVTEAAAVVPPAELQRFLERLATAAERLEGNVAPELLLDALVLAGPRRAATA